MKRTCVAKRKTSILNLLKMIYFYGFLFLFFYNFTTKTIAQNNKTPPDYQRYNKQNDTPVGLFTYSKWIDFNNNSTAEQNEFFGLKKNIFQKGESLNITLYDPQIKENTQIKIRIWDFTGNLINTTHKTYVANRLFTFSNIEKALSPGNYILTVNPDNSQTTYQVEFVLKKTEEEDKENVADNENLLPEGLHLFTEWTDINGDTKFNEDEIIELSKNKFDQKKLNFAIGLSLPKNNTQVVYQIWDTLGNILGMTISNLNIPQYYIVKSDTLKTDTIKEITNFLSPLSKAPDGCYRIVAIVNDQELSCFEKKIYLQRKINLKKDEEYPLSKELTDKSSKIMPVTLKNEIKGFFLFADYIDLNKDSIQQEFEFIKLREKCYNAKTDNVLAQFHLPKFKNHQILLEIKDENGYTIVEETASYQDKPYVFEVSNVSFRLSPGQYSIHLQPENSEENFKETFNIR